MFQEEGYRFMGAAFEVFNQLGYGLAEEVYQQSLELELELREIPFHPKPVLKTFFKGRPLQAHFIPDLIVHDSIVVELKAVKELASEHPALQLPAHRPTTFRLSRQLWPKKRTRMETLNPLEGETREVGIALAGLLRAIRHQGQPLPPPVCVLSGGETTVTLRDHHGKDGRNQELVLSMLVKLGPAGMADTVLLSGGTDGEDGPTDAAGACADARTLGLNAAEFLGRNDGYHFFEATGDLLKTGLTQTNVMDVRVMLLG
jgi:GxxExxY protein